jgi:hypothetical protein
VVAGDSAIAGVSDIAGVQDVIGGPNVFSDLSVAGVPAVVRVSVEPVACSCIYSYIHYIWQPIEPHDLFCFCFDYRTSKYRINGSKISNDWIFSFVKNSNSAAVYFYIIL